MKSRPPRPDNEATLEHWHVLRAERFKNLGRQYGFTESTRDELPEGQRTKA